MDTRKAKGRPNPLALAYQPPSRPRRAPLPGKLFDAVMFGLFVILGAIYFV